MVWLPRWGCNGMIRSSQKLLMARAGVPSGRPWDIGSASYNGNSVSVAATTVNSLGLFISPDGLELYVAQRASTSGFRGKVSQFSMSTPWDITTANLLTQIDIHPQQEIPQGIYFKPDGLRFYVTGNDPARVHEYSLSTAWDLSSFSFVQEFNNSGEESIPTGVSFRSDNGTKMYVTGQSGDGIDEYGLSTGWDISSASFNQFFSVSSQNTAPTDLFFREDGLKLFSVGEDENSIYQYALTVEWDISSTSFQKSFSVSGQTTSPVAVFFKAEGDKMFVLSNNDETIYAYDIG